MTLWGGTMYGLATVTLNQADNAIVAQLALPDVLRALWLVAAGTTVWLAGYLAGPGRVIRAFTARGVNGLRRRVGGDIRSPLTPWLLYGVGTLARVVGALTTSRLGYVGNAASAVSGASWYNQVIILLGFCAQLGVTAAALQVFRQRLRGARATLVILFLAELGYAAVSGDKENFAVAVLAVAIPCTAARQRLPKALIAAVAVIFLVIVIPFTSAYRSTVREAGGNTLSTGQAAGAVPEILRGTLDGGGSPLAVIPDSVGYLLERGQNIVAPAIIVQRTPGQIPYTSPLQLVTGPLSTLIPRAVWPGKPILDTGYEFGQQYFEVPSTVYSSMSITPVGDLYRHGGWWPVLIGMFLLGCGLRLLDDFLDVRASPQMTFLVLLLFPTVVMSEADWTSLLGAIPAFVALWWLAASRSFRRHPAV
jgi:hypothetical protein